jgi:hypothetical protein
MTSATTSTRHSSSHPFTPRVSTKTTECIDIVHDLVIAGIAAFVFQRSTQGLEGMSNSQQNAFELLGQLSSVCEWTYLASAINKTKDSLNHHVSGETQRSITGNTLDILSALTAAGSIVGALSGSIGPQLAVTGLIAAYKLKSGQCPLK